MAVPVCVASQQEAELVLVSSQSPAEWLISLLDWRGDRMLSVRLEPRGRSAPQTASPCKRGALKLNSNYISPKNMRQFSSTCAEKLIFYAVQTAARSEREASFYSRDKL